MIRTSLLICESSHGEPDANNQLKLIDRTTAQIFASKTVCAQVNELSPFVIAQTLTPAAASATITGQITTSDGAGLGGVTILLTGGQSRFTVTDSQGHYVFENLQTEPVYSVTPSLVNYTFAPSSRSFSLIADQTNAVFTALANGAPTLNPLDTTGFFVRQHYVDFLNREPDPSGLNFWANQISSCGADAACVEVKRINVSASFFLSIEFQGTGYLVARIYKAAYGDASGTSTFHGAHQLPVPIVRFNEFLSDTQEIGRGVIVNQGNWQQQLEDNKNTFTNEFVQRSRFTTALPLSMTAAQFVDALNTNAGNPLSEAERNQLVNDLSTGAKSPSPGVAGGGRRCGSGQCRVQPGVCLDAVFWLSPA